MGGFYGNIAHSNKTAIQFDRIYHSRKEMDESIAGDGIFVGRYVLIDYDEPAISGYYVQAQNRFYTTNTVQTTSAIITPVEGSLYLDLTTNKYYKYLSGRYVAATTTSETDSTYAPYVAYYTTDVETYGRGYDSTVWTKTYNTTTNQYKYVMVAELNTVVPNFHMVAEAPADAPIPPYFDANVTNVDYYMHVQSAMINTIASTNSNSDESVKVKNISYGTNPSTGHPTYSASDATIAADIYYNKAGFSPSTRVYSTMDNSLNFTEGSSGRIYGATPSTNGATANDIHRWHLRFPALGNAVCTAWDTMYTTERKRAFLLEDKTGIIVNQDGTTTASTNYTFDQNSVLGVINNIRRRLGVVEAIGGRSITTPAQENDTNIIRFGDSSGTRTYYMPQYANKWTVAGTAGSPTGGNVAYYYKVGNVYKRANLNALASNTAVYTRTAGSTAAPYQIWPSIFSASDTSGNSGEAAIAADNSANNFGTIYGAIALVHKILGTHLLEADNRDDRTVVGLMNQMRDLIANIDTQVTPSRWIITDTNGQLTSSAVPYTAPDTKGVLQGDGNWVARFRQISLTGSSSAVTGLTANNTAVEATTAKNNLFTLIMGNKWFLAAGDNTDKKITLAHALAASGAGNNASSNSGNWQASTDSNTSVLTIPYVSWDEAGHITGKTNLSYYLPFGWKTIAINAQSDSTDQSTGNTVSVIADSSIDTVTFATANKWLTIAGDATNDKITFGHITCITAGTLSPSAEDGWSTTTDNKISIPKITYDAAGHITGVATVDFYLPHSFKTFAVAAQSSDVTNSTGNTTSAIADVSNDTITFGTANKWLTIAGGNDTLTFGHIISGVTAGSYGLSADESIASLDEDNTFEIPYFTVDQAGHITAASTQTVTIPENFTKITIAAGDSGSAQLTANTASVEADTLTDELVFKAANQWLHLAADATNDTISFAHEVHTVTETTPAIDLNGVGTFASDEVTWDGAGHLSTRAKTTFILPYNFKTITVANSEETSAITIDNGSVVAGNQVAEVQFAAGNKWMQFNYNNTNKSITFAHALSPLSATTITPSANSELEANIGADFTLPVFSTDNAGHIISTSTVTYYVPYTFKTVSVSAQSSAVTNLVGDSNATSIVADTMTDTITFESANKWMRIVAAADADKISFGHYVQTITDTVNTYTYNGESDANYTTDFQLDLIDFDEAGHITSRNRRHYKLPYGFKTITLAATTGATSDMTAPVANVTVNAENKIDTFTFADGNKWIVLNLDTTNKVLSIGHKYSGVTSGSYGLASTVSNVNTFNVPYFTVDETGHITTASTQTVTMPNNFSSITVTNSSDTGALAANGTGITPATMTDTLTLASGNKWIKIATENNAVYFAHDVLFESAIENKGTASKPTVEFGATFRVPYFTIDRAGHVTALIDTEIEIPKNSLSHSGEGNVLVSGALTQSTGAFVFTKAYVGSLALTGYTATTSTSVIEATDSINSAFAKLQKQISDEVTARGNAVTTLTGNIATAKQEAIDAANGYTDTEVGTALSTAENYTDGEISTALTTAQGYTDLALSSANSYTDQEIDSAINTATTAWESYADTAAGNALTIAEGEIQTVDGKVNTLAGRVNTAEDDIDSLETSVGNLSDELNDTGGIYDRIGALEGLTHLTPNDVQSLINTALADLMANYEMTLLAPNVTVTNEFGTLTATVTGTTQADTLIYQWQVEREENDETVFDNIANETENTFTPTEDGTYRCVVTRTRGSQTSQANSNPIAVIIE